MLYRMQFGTWKILAISPQIRASPLTEKIVSLLEQNVDVIRGLERDEMHQEREALRHKLHELFQEVEDLKGDMERIWSFGPKKCGPNILFNYVDNRSNFWDNSAKKRSNMLREFESSIINGFQLATAAGFTNDRLVSSTCGRT